ncbi:MAG: hypothetical protein RLZZ628_2093 [Bacteroidota bacterium]|jgi:uncharacterized protein (DUF433 family)
MIALSFQQVEAFIAQMSMDKKVQLFYQLAKDITPLLGIEKTAGICGGSACIIRTRIPVWTLVSFKKLGIQDANLLMAYPNLRQQDLNNAWGYYEANKQEIDYDIKENNDLKHLQSEFTILF